MKLSKAKITKPVATSFLLVAISGAIASAAILSTRMNSAPSSNPWDYTIYTFRNNNSYNSNARQLDIDGDMRSAGNMIFSGNNSFISGNVVAGGKIDKRSSGFNSGREFENTEGLVINNVFGDVYNIAVDSAEVTYESSIKNSSYMIDNLIVGENNLQIDISENYNSAESNLEIDYKFGAFGADFMASAYENPHEWSKVFPFMFTDEISNSKDFIDIGDKSEFIPVAEQLFSGEWKNADKLPESPFQNNMSVNSITEYIEKEKTNNPVFQICRGSETTIIQAESDNSTINPQNAEDKESIIVSGGNFALNGKYESLEEVRFDNWGGCQLIGDYPNLKYIYVSSWSNINLAGSFPSLECIYLTGGQILLGNGDTGFSTENASIIADHGTIIVYSAKNVTLDNCKIMTMNNIVMRGSGKEAESSEFKADNSIFAACNAITFEDMNDDNNERYVSIPVYYSAAPISIVNCNIDMLQGCFVSMNGAMVLTESDIALLRGYIFSPFGVNSNPLNSTAGVYINTYSYNIQPNINNLNKQQNGIWEKGTVHELECVSFPLKLAENVMNISDFISDISKVKNDNGEYVDNYYIKGVQSNAGILVLNSSVFANEDIAITAGKIKNDGESIPIVASRTGDIVITVDTEMDFQGIIYAPNGSVTINGSGHMKGRIFAQELTIISNKLIIEDIDEDLSTLGFTEPDNEHSTTTTKSGSETETTTVIATTKDNVSITTSSDKNISSTTTSISTTSTDVTTSTTVKEHENTSNYTQAEYEYDKLGRLIKVIYDEKNYIEYFYDANGNITDIKKTVDGKVE